MNADAQPVRAASKTAIAAATVRALHFCNGSLPRILDDSIAEKLLGPDMPPPPYAGASDTASGVLLRSRFAEDRLASAVERGVSQLIVLGAGLDTFAYRQPPWAQALSIYEIDQPASQADKLRRLEAASVEIPANLTMVPIDFERTSLPDGCAAGGIDTGKPTFFTCLGVFGYLNRQAVDDIFEYVAGFPAGSEIAFTFFGEPIPAEILAFVNKAGEPLLVFFDPDELAANLQRLGFAEFAILGQEEAERRYFGERSDGLKASRSPMIAAAVKG
jgi:methyltransferase (TIGR00027 family)